jgi:4-hydroxy-tetrahydrodipicolinate synthase
MVLKPQGIIPPIVTPIDEHENVNRKDIFKVVEYLIKGGVHGLFPLGSTGEGYGLINFVRRKKEIINKVK